MAHLVIDSKLISSRTFLFPVGKDPVECTKMGGMADGAGVKVNPGPNTIDEEAWKRAMTSPAAKLIADKFIETKMFVIGKV